MISPGSSRSKSPFVAPPEPEGKVFSHAGSSEDGDGLASGAKSAGAFKNLPSG